jgi:hypothetical protein
MDRVRGRASVRPLSALPLASLAAAAEIWNEDVLGKILVMPVERVGREPPVPE